MVIVRENTVSEPNSRPFGNAALNWLTGKPVQECAEVHEQLLRTLPDSVEVSVMHLVWTVALPALAIYLTRAAWAPWLLFAMTIVNVSIFVLRHQHDEALRAHVRPPYSPLLLARFTAILGLSVSVCLCYVEGNVVLVALATGTGMAFNGYIWSRLAAFPRFARLMYLLTWGFLTVGLCLTPLSGFDVLLWFVPPGLFGSFALLSKAHEELLVIVRAQHEHRRQATHDPLTRLPNRILLGERLEELSRLVCATQSQRSFALLALDLDGFKSINDTLGHAAGDRLLQGVAVRLLGTVRSIDLVARIGGDEFVLVLSGACDEHAKEVANRVIDAMRAPIEIKPGSTVIPRTSIGIAIAPRDGLTPDEILKAADRALYAAKGAGKGRWATFQGEQDPTRESQATPVVGSIA